METVREVLRLVIATIEKYSLFSRGERVVVAVSGGADSVALLDILHELSPQLGLDLVVAHFNHCLRPGEDERESAFLKELADLYQLPLFEGKSSKNLPTSPSLEEEARAERYDFFARVARELDSEKIALGHTMNDQAETVIMRLLRGSGPLGLSGIPPKRNQGIVRPLIEISRPQILAYLRAKGLHWIEDSSNRDLRFLRNRIRHELIPILQRYQPNLIQILSQTAEILRQDEEWLTNWAEQWLEVKAERLDSGALCVKISEFLALPSSLQARVLRAMLSSVGGGLRRISARHITAIQRLLTASRPQGELNLPLGLLVRKSYQTFQVEVVGDEGDKGFLLEIKGIGSYRLERLQTRIRVDEVDPCQVKPRQLGQWEIVLDADKVSYPILVRPFRPGDRIAPLGLKGTKKVKDLFIERKIPRHLRRLIPIFESRGKIMWVAGIRIDDRFKLTEESRNALRIRLTGGVEQWGRN